MSINMIQEWSGKLSLFVLKKNGNRVRWPPKISFVLPIALDLQNVVPEVDKHDGYHEEYDPRVLVD